MVPSGIHSAASRLDLGVGDWLHADSVDLSLIDVLRACSVCLWLTMVDSGYVILGLSAAGREIGGGD